MWISRRKWKELTDAAQEARAAARSARESWYQSADISDVEAFVNSEEFLDKLIERINRKQILKQLTQESERLGLYRDAGPTPFAGRTTRRED